MAETIEEHEPYDLGDGGNGVSGITIEDDEMLSNAYDADAWKTPASVPPETSVADSTTRDADETMFPSDDAGIVYGTEIRSGATVHLDCFSLDASLTPSMAIYGWKHSSRGREAILALLRRHAEDGVQVIVLPDSRGRDIGTILGDDREVTVSLPDLSSELLNPFMLTPVYGWEMTNPSPTSQPEAEIRYQNKRERIVNLLNLVVTKHAEEDGGRHVWSRFPVDQSDMEVMLESIVDAFFESHGIGITRGSFDYAQWKRHAGDTEGQGSTLGISEFIQFAKATVRLMEGPDGIPDCDLFVWALRRVDAKDPSYQDRLIMLLSVLGLALEEWTQHPDELPSHMAGSLDFYRPPRNRDSEGNASPNPDDGFPRMEPVITHYDFGAAQRGGSFLTPGLKERREVIMMALVLRLVDEAEIPLGPRRIIVMPSSWWDDTPEHSPMRKLVENMIHGGNGHMRTTGVWVLDDGHGFNTRLSHLIKTRLLLSGGLPSYLLTDLCQNLGLNKRHLEFICARRAEDAAGKALLVRHDGRESWTVMLDVHGKTEGDGSVPSR